jgi:hypothetical protein
VLTPDHLEHLIIKYLPEHPGVRWREGEPLPCDRFGILKRNGRGPSNPPAPQ